MKRENWRERLVARFYTDRQGWIDGSTEFHALCERYIGPGSTILEIGAGPSNATSRFLGRRGRLSVVDVDEDVLSNDAAADAHVIRDDRYPFPSASFDACVSNYVLEHVRDAAAHLSEVARVLRPGGHYLFRTPNRFHYVAQVSSVLPHRMHLRLANRFRALDEHAHPPYPTHYALNTAGRIRRVARAAGLSVTELRLVEKEPSYGMIHPALFMVFTAYERFVNSSEIFAGLRANIFGVLTKLDSAEPTTSSAEPI